MYAIVDIETTGLQVIEDRITEIAIFIHDGNQVTDQFHSLINPERHLPEYITRLTGITYEMLVDAPKFYEVAKKIVEITEGKVFVAHNAHFDYTFVRNEFKNLGYTFQRKTLCTVRLSRKIFSGFPSYSLGKICNQLGIVIENHHRAKSDAEATCKLFEILIQKNEKQLNKTIIDHEIKAQSLPPKINHETFNALPEAPGVYYFHNDAGDIIYIGKSTHIKKRIASHFSTNLKSKKHLELKNQIADISYELTGNELIALLLESDEIKKHKPIFNKAQRRSSFHWGIFSKLNPTGYLELYVEKNKNQPQAVHYLAQSSEEARRVLYVKVEEFQLCMKLCNLYKSKTACFDYQIKKCLGACIAQEMPEDYNKRVEEAIESFNQLAQQSMLMVAKGRNADEKALVCVENGRYLGFGYIDSSIQITDLEEAKMYIKSYQNNRDTQKILYAWVKKYPYSVVRF
jgi:DNA polymerase III subunit epsilon